MQKRQLQLQSKHLWIVLFGFWGLALTGVLHSVIGSPGVLQAYRLAKYLEVKQAKIQELENELGRMETERARLEKNKFAQEREVRKVLGYAAPDEIIFHFQN